MPTETIVHSNSLIDASYSLKLNELRIINLGATLIDSRNKSTGEVVITVEQFNKAYGLSSGTIYCDLRKSISSIMRKPIKIFDYKENRQKEIAWITQNSYSLGDNGSYITFKFSPEIEPFLFELKERFTTINFEQAAKLNTSPSFRIYQWLKEVEHLKSYKTNSNSITRTLSIEWMKDKLEMTGKHARWSKFEEIVIRPSIVKINANTDISVFYKPIKSGRNVTAVEFTYVLEKDESCIKPMRPRLYRRPKVTKGSHEEGVWMRKNLALLLEYEAQLKRYDDKEKLALTDLRKIAEYASICDRFTEDRAKKEIELRTLK